MADLFVPSLVVGHPPHRFTVRTDSVHFPQLEADLAALSWPEVSAKMWDTTTMLEIVGGRLPIKSGRSVRLQQTSRRLTWIPRDYSVGVDWKGEPKPELLTLQWTIGPEGQHGQPFGWPQRGSQWLPSCSACDKTPPWVEIPTSQGAVVTVGRESRLGALVTLDEKARSKVTGIMVVVRHHNAETLAELAKSADPPEDANG